MLIITTRPCTSPHVAHVKNAVYTKVESVDEGTVILHDCIDYGEARWVRAVRQ